MRRVSRLVALSLALVAPALPSLPGLPSPPGPPSTTLGAQRGPAADPLVKENVTVKVAPHTYVIPDGGVGLVPNVGIVVGSRATLVIDPGLGRRNGETVLREVAKVSKNTELFIASTHFHAEHTTGYVAFPASAKYVNSTVQEQEFAEGGMQMVKMFSGRSPATADILKDAARGATPTSRSIATYRSISAACASGSWSSGPRTPAATPASSSRATTSSSPATSS